MQAPTTPKPWYRRWWVWVLLGIAAILLVFTVFTSSEETDVRVTMSQFIGQARTGEIVRIESFPTEIRYEVKSHSTIYSVPKEETDSARAILADAGLTPEELDRIEFDTEDDVGPAGRVLRIFLQFLPIIFIIGTLTFFLRRTRRATTAAVVSDLDPVCGTRAPGSSTYASTFQNTTYRFCSAGHKNEFDSDPVRYLLRT